MSREQIAVLITISFILVLYISLLTYLSFWQRKHKLFYVVYRSPETHLSCSVVFFRSKSDLSKWLSDYGHYISLFGVYSLVPNEFFKEFGGFYKSK